MEIKVGDIVWIPSNTLDELEDCSEFKAIQCIVEMVIDHSYAVSYVLKECVGNRKCVRAAPGVHLTEREALQEIAEFLQKRIALARPDDWIDPL